MARSGLAAKCTLLLLLLIYPLLFRQSFTTLSHWYYDFVQVNPLILWYMLAIVGLVVASTFMQGKLGLVSFFSVILVFSALEAITNYNVMGDIDVNLQGSSVNVIAQDGHLSDAWNLYHVFYPGFFVLWTSVSLVTGLDVRASNVVIMLPIAVILLGVLLVLLYRKLGIQKGPSFTVALLAFLLMNFHRNEGTFLHFNTRLYALVLTILALLLFLNMIPRIGKKEQIVFVVVFSVVVLSHILFPLVLLTLLFVYWLMEKRRNTSLGLTLFLCAIIYIAHHFTTVSRMLGFYIGSILDYLYVRLAEEMLITVPFVTENVPILSVMLRTYYKILLAAVGLLAAYSLIKLRSKRNVRFMLWVLLAGSISFGATFFTASLGNSMVRGLIFLAIPLAFLSLSVIVGRSKKTMQSRKLSVLTLLVSLIIIPQFLLVHETSLRFLNLPSVDAACLFIANTKNGQPIAAYGGFPVYYCFYDPKFRDYNMIGYPVESSAPLVRNLSDIADFFIQSDEIKFIAFRNIQVWGYNLSSFDEAYTMWTIEVFLPLERELGKVYDNGFERIYR